MFGRTALKVRHFKNGACEIFAPWEVVQVGDKLQKGQSKSSVNPLIGVNGGSGF